MSATATPAAPATATTPPPLGSGPRPWKWTREQYYKLGELGFFDGRRVELIYGEIVEMSPINWPHVVGCQKAAELLKGPFAGVGWVGQGVPLNLGHSARNPTWPSSRAAFRTTQATPRQPSSSWWYRSRR